jgi:predicted chitinase
MSWWAEVAGRLGLPADGKVHHLHPIGLIGCFEKTGGLIDVEAFLTLYAAEHTRFAPGTPALTAGSRENLRRTVLAINKYYEDSTDVASVYEVAYMLATVRHETYYYPTSEFFSEKPEYGKLSYFDQYDPVLAPEPRQRKKAVLYGNVEKGDGFKYRGRGCVHLTWKVNYQKFSDLTGFDYVADPDAAAKVEHSVPIMIMGMAKGLFTGKKLSSFFAGERHDYLSARQIINGNDAATLIASYAERFEKMLTRSSKLQGW